MENSKSIGERTEGMILGKLMSLGYIVLLPFGNNQRYDLVIEKDNIFLRVQCKTARFRNGCVKFNPYSTNGFKGTKKDYRGQIEYFAVFCADTNKFYLIPVKDVGSKSGLLRVDEPKRSSKGCRIVWAKQYEI